MSNSADSGKQSKINLLDWILLLGSLDVYSTKGFEKAKKKKNEKSIEDEKRMGERKRKSEK